jgi:hypothetical protein
MIMGSSKDNSSMDQGSLRETIFWILVDGPKAGQKW